MADVLPNVVVIPWLDDMPFQKFNEKHKIRLFEYPGRRKRWWEVRYRARLWKYRKSEKGNR